MISIGTTKGIVIPKGERSAEASVGKTRGLLTIPLTQVEEDHLYIRIKRELDSNDYEITIRRGGPVLIKTGIGQEFEKMTSSENFTDTEIKEAGGIRFRLSDRVRDDIMKTYVEIGLNWDAGEGSTESRTLKRFFITIEKLEGKLEKKDEDLFTLLDPDDEY